MGRLEDLYVKRVADYLVDKAYDIVMTAKRTKDAENRTYNQYDAYGAAVYYKGSLVQTVLTGRTHDADNKVAYKNKHGRRIDNMSWNDVVNKEEINGKHKGWAKYGIPDGFGYEWARMFVKEYRPQTDGFELVVFNAAFYSNILEHGAQRNARKKYQIISQVVGELQDLKKQFAGSNLRGININIT